MERRRVKSTRVGWAVAAFLIVMVSPRFGVAEEGGGSAGSSIVTMRAARLEVDLEAGTASGEDVRVSSCGVCAPPWTVSARRAVLRSNGDLDMVLPVLRVGAVPVLALPWLRVRTARRWGLLLPRLGARSGGGFEVGQGLWFPLGPRYELTANVAYLTELVGAELELLLEGDDVTLRVLGQAGANGGGALVDGRASYITQRHGLGASTTTAVAARLEWTLDPALARQLSLTPRDEARRHEVSSVAVVQTTSTLQVALLAELAHGLTSGPPNADYVPLAELSVHLLPVRAGPLWFSLRQSTRSLWSPLSLGGESWVGWHTSLEPRLSTVFTLGPVLTRVTATSVLAVWPRSTLGTAADGRGLLVLAGDLSVPLVKRSGSGAERRRHLVEPALRYRLLAYDTLSGSTPWTSPLGATFDPLAWPVAGNLLWLELRSALTFDRTGRSVRATVGQMVSFEGLHGVRVPSRLEGRLELDLGLAEVFLAVSVDERQWTVGEAWSRALVGRSDSHGLELEWRWLEEGAASQSGPNPGALVPVVVPWSALLAGHTLGGRLWTTLGGVVRLEAEAWADLARRSLIVAGGGLTYAHRCGCLSASLRAWYRAGRQWPDVLVTVDLGGLGPGGRSLAEYH